MLRYTINDIKKSFESDGYILITDIYLNDRFQKLDYICPNGHQHSISWHHWNISKNRCPYCAGVVSPTIEFIRSEFEKEGYKFLTNEYKNNKQNLEYVCPNGHKYYVRWANWQSGRRCPCFAGRPPLTIDFIRTQFKKEGYDLLSDRYISAHVKLKYKCNNGHVSYITWSNFKNGYRCSVCANINNSGSGHPNWRGGISFEPYCQIWSDKEYKADIRERDGNVCLNPYCFHNNEKVLHIHHIDYNKKNCAPQNLITLCRSCNLRANTNRKWHTEWYRTILNKRHGYKY